MAKTVQISIRLIAISVTLAVLIFTLDLLLPLGVAGGVPYVALVLISLWSRGRRFTYIVAAVSTVLTTLGFFLSAPGSLLWMVLINRVLALFAIWVTTILSLQRKQAQAALTRLNDELKESVEQRTVQLQTELAERVQVEETLQESEEKYHALLEYANDSIFLIDPATRRFLDVNETAARRLGYSREELLALTPDELSPKLAVGQFQSNVTVLQEGGSLVFETDHRRKDGTLMPVEISSRLIQYGGQKVIQGFIRDITERRKIEQALKFSETRMRAVLDTAAEAILTTDEDLIVESMNPAGEDLSRYSTAEMLGSSICSFLPQLKKSMMTANHFERDPSEDRPNRFETGGKTKDGTSLIVEVSISEVLIGTANIYTIIVRDISERKRSEAQLKEFAIRDGLSELYNRTYFIERAEEAFHFARRHHLPFSLCMCDLDFFKKVNDTFGHRTGDRVITTFAGIIRRTIRLEDIAGRYGGEEFVIAFPSTDIDEAFAVCDRLRAALESAELKSDSNEMIQVTASFGVAVITSDTESVPDLIAEADAAMYAAKKAGRNQVFRVG